jgi:hypothetical protein
MQHLGRAKRTRYRRLMAAKKPTTPKPPKSETHEKVSLYLPHALANRLRHKAVDARMKITAMVERYIQEGLDRDNGK